jgi:anti-sigma-K factor RskA
MRYGSAPLQDRLAAEFVLGNLRGAARRRLLTLMRVHPGLRDRVAQWEERLFPLALRAPRVEPPARVWRAIRARTAPRRSAWSAARSWFGRVALGGFAAALLAAVVPFGVTLAPPVTLIAVLNDGRAQPGILASWTPHPAGRRQLGVRIVAHPSMPPDTAWQAWAVSGPQAQPVALGFIGTDENQTLELSPAAAASLQEGALIGVSVEAKGGSVTGRPGGPFVFEGTLLKLGS